MQKTTREYKREASTGMSDNGSDDDSLLSMEEEQSQSTGIAPGPAGIDDVATQYGGKKALYAVLGSKVAVYLVLIMAAASVGGITWYLTTNEERSSFKGEVRDVSSIRGLFCADMYTRSRT
jgi:hypothetical protein